MVRRPRGRAGVIGMRLEGGEMNHRRLVGIDLGIATAYTVRVLDGEGAIVAKRKAWPTVESLAAVEAAALAGCPDGTKLEVVL
jgi:hypothetical protein